MSAAFRHLLLCTPCLLPSCVSYEAHPADASIVAAEVAQRDGGAFDLDHAIELAFRQNATLRQLEAEARAAATAQRVPVQLQGEYRGRSEAVGFMLDPIAWLGLGPRGARLVAAERQHFEALARLAQARWQVASELLACYLIDAALAECSVPPVDVDSDRFEQAGLASTAAANRVRASQSLAELERIDLAKDRDDNRARLLELLALPGSAALDIVTITQGQLQQPAGEPKDILTRPDLALATAMFEVADADFRQAVADQYPSLQIGPNFSLRADPLRAMGMLNLPIGLDGQARAARERREAARAQLEVAYLAADRSASDADRELSAATAALGAATTSLTSSRLALQSARVGVDVDPDAFDAFAEAAAMALRDTKAVRQAAIRHARARANRAREYGWPRAHHPTEGDDVQAQGVTR